MALVLVNECTHLNHSVFVTFAFNNDPLEKRPYKRILPSAKSFVSQELQAFHGRANFIADRHMDTAHGYDVAGVSTYTLRFFIRGYRFL